MPTLLEMATLAGAAYSCPPTVDGGWLRTDQHLATGRMDGFQAATYVNNGVTVLAFRGTAQGMDAVADLKLGSGMNTSYFSDAEDYAFAYQHLPNVFICGHSLGGAITQVVANRRGFRFATFNAPGVAIFASRNIASASPLMTAVRIGGGALSVLRHPMQAARDVRATFNRVRGINLCLRNDVVSKIGVHYGEIVTIPGTSANPLIEHKIATVITALGSNAVGRQEVATL